MVAPSAAQALREAWGDRKPPDITRKITACVACRKLKIKCRMNDAQPPCTRCKARGLPCSVNKSIQMLLENDATWKEEMEQRVVRLEKALASSTPPSSLPPLADARLLLPAQNGNTSSNINPRTPSDSRPISSMTLNYTCSPGAFPAASMTDLPSNSLEQPSTAVTTGLDLVSKGVITLSDAELLFVYYHQNLNQYLHNIVSATETLSDIRYRSSMLLDAICTVAAYCTGSELYQQCHDALTEAAGQKTFGKQHSFDDIRALCIGSFWLSDISYALCSLAVRLAAEVNLHRCITKMPHSNPKCYERTRLYFIVYVCDHHCSLRFGRPPMMRSLRSLRSPRTLLEGQHALASDVKLIAEVELWALNCQVFDRFGADVGTALHSDRHEEIQTLAKAIDQWYLEWQHSLNVRGQNGQATRWVMDLHREAAKLCLLSHVFRGSAARFAAAHSDSASSMGQHRLAGLESFAVDTAVALCSLLASCGNLMQLPCYFATMGAFSSVFLLQLRSHCQELPVASNTGTKDLLGALKVLSQAIHEQLDTYHANHPLLVVACGLDVAIGDTFNPGANFDTAHTMSTDIVGHDIGMGLFDDVTLNQVANNDMGWMSFPFSQDLAATCLWSDVT